MILVEDNDVVQAFSANAAVKSLNIRILPGAMVCGQDLFYAHRFDMPSKVVSVDAISITKKVSRRRVPRERLDNLLCRPFGCGILRYVEVHDAAPGMTQDDKDEKQPKLNGRYDKEVHPTMSGM